MRLYIESTVKSYKGGWKSYLKTFIKNFGLPYLSNDEINLLKKEDNPKVIDKIIKEIYYEQSKSLFRIL